MTPRGLLLLFLLLSVASAQSRFAPAAPSSSRDQLGQTLVGQPDGTVSAALIRLEKSPRHQEWVQVKHGDRTVTAFVVYPEVKDKALTVVVIHENRGLNDWARAVADRLAENGYIAIAPDLLTGAAPGGGNTKDFATQGDATAAIAKLPPPPVAPHPPPHP